MRCSDTDVFVLLIDLKSNGHLCPLTKLIMLIGIGAKYREIDMSVQGIVLVLEINWLAQLFANAMLGVVIVITDFIKLRKILIWTMKTIWYKLIQ